MRHNIVRRRELLDLCHVYAGVRQRLHCDSPGSRQRNWFFADFNTYGHWHGSIGTRRNPRTQPGCFCEPVDGNDKRDHNGDPDEQRQRNIDDHRHYDWGHQPNRLCNGNGQQRMRQLGCGWRFVQHLPDVYPGCSERAYTATLTVADNAPGSPQNVALSGSGANPPDFSVVGTPASQTVAPGGSTSFNITVNSSGGTFSNAVALTVSGLPTGATGSFSPASVTPGSESASSTLTVQTGTSTQQTAQNSAWPLAAPALAALGLFFIPGKRRRRWITLGMLLLASLGTLTALSGCGGGFRFGQPAQTYTLTITGTSGNDTHSTTVQLTVQ